MPHHESEVGSSHGLLGNSTGMRREEYKTHQIAYGPPLDYSNGHLTDLRQVLEYEPRIKGACYAPTIDPTSGFYKSSSLIISYNRIKSLEPLRWTLKKLMKEPMWLRWVDASYNHISELDISLRLFKHLRKFNLDGNPIQSFVELTVFMKLPRLHHLSLSHCPISNAPYYRAHVISLLPQLLTLDSRTILPSERDVTRRAYFTRLPLVEPVSPPETIEEEEEEPFPDWLTEIIDHMTRVKEDREQKRINREKERRRQRRIRRGLPEEPEEGEVDDDDDDDDDDDGMDDIYYVPTQEVGKAMSVPVPANGRVQEQQQNGQQQQPEVPQQQTVEGQS